MNSSQEKSEIVDINNHAVNVCDLHNSLIRWGQKHFRQFPWRLTEDPYLILLAEAMLHRTQASQVLPIYKRFIERYPNLPTLSESTKTELHYILYSLGLRWRIDMIHEMALTLTEYFDQEVPQEKEKLLSLPGVSDYIASAVRCFAWNLPEPLIDTNTVRIVGRLFGLEIKASSRRNRQYKRVISQLVCRYDARSYNYALLDLADLVCTKRRSPDCMNCPLKTMCVYGATRLAGQE